jgi:hypothetical protein
MNVMFNSQERTLREIVALALSAGWQVTKVTQAPGYLFGYIVAVPIGADPVSKADVRPTEQKRATDSVRQHKRANAVSSTWTSGWDDTVNSDGYEEEFPRRPSSRSGTPIFGSRAEAQCVANALAKFGGGVKRYRGPGAIGRGLDDRRFLSDASNPSGPSLGSLSTSTSTSNSSSSAAPLKPPANLVLAKQRSAFDIRSSFNNDRYGSTSASNIAHSRSATPQTVPAHSGDPRRPQSPSPINMQITNAPRGPPPPAPPRSLRRPSSLANMRTRTVSLNQLEPPVIPPMPSFSPLHSTFCASIPDSSLSSSHPVQPKMVVPQRTMSPAPAYGRTLRGRASYNGLSTSGVISLTNPGGMRAYRDLIPSTSPPAYSHAPPSSSFIPVRSAKGSGSSISRASSAFATSSSTRSMHVSVSQQIGVSQNGASVCVKVAPQRKPVLKEVGRRTSSPQLSSTYYSNNLSATMATAQVRFSENVANGGIGRSPAPQTTTSKKPANADRGEKEKGVGLGVANYLRGAGQRLGGILKFERQDGHGKTDKRVRMEEYLTDSARIQDRGGQMNGGSIIVARADFSKD